MVAVFQICLRAKVFQVSICLKSLDCEFYLSSHVLLHGFSRINFHISVFFVMAVALVFVLKDLAGYLPSFSTKSFASAM